jgi:hypothetical protein
MATFEHFKAFKLKNYICIIALATNLQAVFFCKIREITLHSSTIKLISLLIFIKDSI